MFGRDSESALLAWRYAGQRSMLVVFGFMEFEQYFHVSEGVINMSDQALFHCFHEPVGIVDALAKVGIGIVDALGNIAHSAVGVDHRYSGQDDRNSERQNLLIGQGILLPDSVRLTFSF